MPSSSARRRFTSAALLASVALAAACDAPSSSSAHAAVAESTARSSAALSSASQLFAVAGSQLEQGAIGGAFTAAGDAYGVTAFAGFHGNLYVASGDGLWVRGAVGPGTGNDWTRVGDAKGAVALTSHQGRLFMVAGDKLWVRDAIAPGADWTEAGDAHGVTGMASLDGQLYVTAGQALYKRGAIGPGTGNDWSYAGDAYGVTGMASYGGHLYVASAGQLWKRGAIGPGTGNDWSLAGPAAGVSALASLPVDCAAGFSAADCPAPGVDLTGLTDVAFGHAASQSSTLAGGTADRAVDANLGTSSSTTVEPSPWLSVDLGFDRTVQALAITTSTPGAVVDLLDAAGSVVANEPLSAFTSVGNGTYVASLIPVIARSVRVHAAAAAGVELDVAQVQVFAPLLPASWYPFWKHQSSGVCWKSTYGRGAGGAISTCGAGQEQNGALCYPQCAPGYYGVGPVCWQSCPAGWTDTGVSCLLPASIVSADNSSCPWYDKCGLTFAKGCSQCPAGYADDGCTCRVDPQSFTKASYGRGAGAPLQCASGQEEQAGLCYAPCASGYDGVGPVCWSQCGGTHAVACGALACASAATSCSSFVQEAVDSTVNFAISTAALVATWGGSGPFTTVRSLAQSVQVFGVKQLTDEIANLLIAAAQGTSLTDGIPGLTTEIANATASQIVASFQNGQINWTLIDPTGILAVVAAFNQATC